MFCKAAEMSLKGDEKDDAANDFWTASKSYKKSNPECTYSISPMLPAGPAHLHRPALTAHLSPPPSSRLSYPYHLHPTLHLMVHAPQWPSPPSNVRSSSIRRRASSARPPTGRRRLLPSSLKRGAILMAHWRRSKLLENCIPRRTLRREFSLPSPSPPSAPSRADQRRGGINRTANGCFKEAAELAGTLQQYDRAVRHFEQVAQASLGSALTKYSVKDYYLKAGMCWLAGGVSDFVAFLRRWRGRECWRGGEDRSADGEGGDEIESRERREEMGSSRKMRLLTFDFTFSSHSHLHQTSPLLHLPRLSLTLRLPPLTPPNASRAPAPPSSPPVPLLFLLIPPTSHQPTPQDVVSTQRALSAYEQQDPSFSTTREAKFLHGITDAFDQGDAEAFTGHVAEFDR